MNAIEMIQIGRLLPKVHDEIKHRLEDSEEYEHDPNDNIELWFNESEYIEMAFDDGITHIKLQVDGVVKKYKADNLFQVLSELKQKLLPAIHNRAVYEILKGSIDKVLNGPVLEPVAVSDEVTFKTDPKVEQVEE